MAKKLYYTRVWQPPCPTITDAIEFKYLFKKRKLACLRAAVENGEWQQQLCSDTDSDGDARSHSSTSCAASPIGATSIAQELCSKLLNTSDQQISTAEQQSAEAELQAELATRKAEEDQQLQEIYAKLLADQAEEEERKLAEKVQLVAQHAEATKQVNDVQQRLEELQQHKHDLVKQLKRAMQAEEAAKQQATLQQQQQQEQWAAQPHQQEQQQQQHHPHAAYRGLAPLGIPPGPGHIPALYTPGAHGPGMPGSVTPGATTGSYTASAGYTPGHTPAGGYTPGAGLFSPGSATARSQWLFSTPAQPPPPPRQPADHVGGTASTAAAASGQPGKQMPRVASWGQPPAPPRASGPAAAEACSGAGPDAHMPDASRFGSDHVQQQQGGSHGNSWQVHTQDHARAVRDGVARSPRQSVNGSRPWHSISMAADAPHHMEPPESPEEGEALPSPRMPGQLHHRSRATTAVGSRAADAGLQLPARSLHNRGEGFLEQSSTDGLPIAPVRRTSSGADRSADRDSDRDRPAAEYDRPGGLLHTSSVGGAGGSGFGAEGHSHQSSLLRSNSGGGGGAGASHLGASSQPLQSPGSAGAAGSGGSYRTHSGLGRSQSASLAEREHAGFRAASDGPAAHSADGAEGPMLGSGGSRQPRSGGQYAHGQYHAAGAHGQHYPGGTGRIGDDASAAFAPSWRGERRRSSSSNIDRFGQDARAAGSSSFMGGTWQGEGSGATGDRRPAVWGRGDSAGAASGVEWGAAGGHAEGMERKPWSRNLARGGAWR